MSTHNLYVFMEKQENNPYLLLIKNTLSGAKLFSATHEVTGMNTKVLIVS